MLLSYYNAYLAIEQKLIDQSNLKLNKLHDSVMICFILYIYLISISNHYPKKNMLFTTPYKCGAVSLI